MAKKRKKNTRDAHRAKIAAAMPEVRKLVKRFGRQAVGNCIGKLRAEEKGQAELLARRFANFKRPCARIEFE